MSHSFRTPLMILMALLVLLHSTNAQVTFSRDWTAGKRSIGSGIGSDCAPSIKSTIALCQMLVSELRQLASCELRNHLMLSSPAGQEDDPNGPFSPSTRAGR